MLFFVGLWKPQHAARFSHCMVSANTLRTRKSDFAVNDWVMDSGAFTEISTHGDYRSTPEEYGDVVLRWRSCGRLVAAVGQDYMCEPWILERTGKTIREHQLLTVDRYDALVRYIGGRAPIMPVLQGYEPAEYVRHVLDYGARLAFGSWVGVGSVCKRNASPRAIEDVLLAIYRARPDLRLHGFGIKLTSLTSDVVRSLLYSADSMAWSFAARRQGRNGNSPDEAAAYVDRVHRQEWQRDIFTPTRTDNAER